MNWKNPHTRRHNMWTYVDWLQHPFQTDLINHCLEVFLFLFHNVYSFSHWLVQTDRFPPKIYKKSSLGSLIGMEGALFTGSGMICKVELQYFCKLSNYNNFFSLVNVISSKS